MVCTITTCYVRPSQQHSLNLDQSFTQLTTSSKPSTWFPYMDLVSAKISNPSRIILPEQAKVRIQALGMRKCLQGWRMRASILSRREEKGGPGAFPTVRRVITRKNQSVRRVTDSEAQYSVDVCLQGCHYPHLASCLTWKATGLASSICRLFCCSKLTWGELIQSCFMLETDSSWLH